MVEHYLNSNNLDDAAFKKINDEVINYVKSKGGKLNQSVAFANTEGMLEAKAAYLADLKDGALQYAKNKGVNIPNEDMNYIIMSAYNGGPGAAQDLIDMIAGGAKNVSKTGGKRKEVHANLQPRMRYTAYLNEMPMQVFPQQGSLQQTVGQPPINNQ
jgi:hypothetical protein